MSEPCPGCAPLGTGQSRRTTDRLTALLADAGVVSRSAGWIRVLCTASELDEACRHLGAQLYALREQDARRLASVSAFAEAAECKLSCLSQYLGEGASPGCGRCSACVSELLTPSQESLAPQASARRGAVQEFSVQAVSARVSGVVPSGAQPEQVPLTATLADRDARLAVSAGQRGSIHTRALDECCARASCTRLLHTDGTLSDRVRRKQQQSQ